ncbi:MAG TPA: helix-turn-helix domain-containing protein [Lacipirellula sp.]
MEQRFVKFEEALEKLGVTPERLNQLREDNELRAYRDGASRKFRADEIERMAEEGVPDSPPPSDIGLASDDELVDASPLAGLDDLDDLKLADDDDLTLGGSELELASDQEDTVTAGASDAALNIHADTQEGSDPSDSILLSEEVLGESAHSPSTIIGRRESEDADLELVTEDDDLTVGSDVQLAGGASDVLSSHIAGSGVLDELEKESGATSAFENLEELEIDLAAESGRILGDVPAAPPKGSIAQQQEPETSDLSLMGDDDGTDPAPEELAAAAPKKPAPTDGPTSDLELATDEDDFVLAGEGGSDITLDSGDSGINLLPSDSGLALDDIPLEAGGSAILDSLSLGDKGAAASDLSLVGSDPQLGQTEAVASLQTDDAFRLTPLGEIEEDSDSSSQVIALDAGLDDLGAGDAGILGEDAFAEEGVVVAEDYGDMPAGDFAAAPYAATATRGEGEYSVWNIVGLGSCFFLLLFATILMFDMVRNIWSWDENLALNDSLLDSLLKMFGLST